MRGRRASYRLRSGSLPALALAAFLTLGSMGGAQAQVVAVVYGEPITALDISHRMRLDQMTGGKARTQKDALEELINDKLKIREGARFGITVSNAEVEEAFAGMASRMGGKPDQLTQQLRGSGTSDSALKGRVKADMVWQRLVRGRFASTLTVGESDILSSIGAKAAGGEGTSGNTVGYEYTLWPIMFVATSEGSAAARRGEAEAFRARFQNCETGLPQARAMRNVAVRARIVRNSADVPEQMRKMLDTMPIGRLTPPEVTRHGVETFALCGRVESSSSDTPQKRAAREKLFTQRFEQQADSYLKRIRKEALVEYKRKL